MKEILQCEDDNEIMIVLKGNKLIDIEGILVTPANMLQNLQYSPIRDPKDSLTIKFGETNILRELKGYMMYLEDQGIEYCGNYKDIDK